MVIKIINIRHQPENTLIHPFKEDRLCEKILDFLHALDLDAEVEYSKED